MITGADSRYVLQFCSLHQIRWVYVARDDASWARRLTSNAAASASAVQEKSDSELRSARSPDYHARSSSATIRITRYRDLTQKTGC
jgi:hypothetical protein